MNKYQSKRVRDSIEEYSNLVGGEPTKCFIITDEREDAIQYCLKISDDEYVYFEYNFEKDYIHDEHIEYSDMTKEDIEYASETFAFDTTEYTDAMKKQLVIELNFESGITQGE